MLGEVAEWSIAAVLKTVELRGSGGSNPSLSAEWGSRLIGLIGAHCKVRRQGLLKGSLGSRLVGAACA